jgi:asparagine synthase (glutamine-hydrolysing)
MPGIVGLITKRSRDWAEAQLGRMVGAICHERFYTTGTWVEESLGVYVGWVARKGSRYDGMPLANERGDVVMVFSGEEYPGAIVDRRSEGTSRTAKVASLVERYENDAGFPAGLNGRFHGLVMDRARGRVVLFNDRYGMHRICYHEGEEAFYFAAEAKAIIAVCPELRSPDPQGLGEFVACSCVLGNRTIFKNIHVLPQASAWVFRGRKSERKNCYFQPREWEEQSSLDPEAYYRELRDVVSQSLPRYFGGQERIGMTLTGGLDTRVILAWRKPLPGQLPCYTFGGLFRDCQDVRIARRIAKQCQQSYQVIKVGSEFVKEFRNYAERSIYLTEGGVDVSRSSDLYVSEKARAIAPVKVVGTYGSEIIRHSLMFKPLAPMPGLYQPELLSHIDQARETYLMFRREHPVTFAAFRQSPWSHQGVLTLEESQLTVRSPFLDNDFVRTVFRAPKGDVSDDDDVRLRLIAEANSGLGRIRTDRGVGGDSGRIVSMASRFLLEFLAKAEYAYDYGMPQWVARVDHMFSRFHFERLFLGRHKLLHFRLWYRTSLAEYVQQVLLDPLSMSRHYVNRKVLEGVVRGHLAGRSNYTTEIHKLLTLELLHRQFFDPQ